MLGDLRRAVELLTLVPVRADWPEGRRVRIAGWFPLVGLSIGVVGWGVMHLLQSVGWYGEASLVIAAVIVAFSAWITRSLHYDGLADIADAWWGGDTLPRRHEIMKDSSIGAFGATAIALVVALQVTSIGSIIGGLHQIPLLLVVPLSRLSSTFSAWFGTPARDGGLGRSVMGRPGMGELVAAGAVVVICAVAGGLALGIWGLVFVAVGIAAALVVPHVIALRFGGVTGDVMGASVMVVETLLYLFAAFGLELLQ